jgi:hypothetical protein
VFRFDDHDHPERSEFGFDEVGNCVSHAFLNLWPPRHLVNHPRQLAQSRHPPTRDVADVGFAHKWQQVMFAHAVEGYVANQHEFIVLFFEDFLQMTAWFDMQPTEDFRVHSGHAFGGFPEPVAVGIFANGQQYLTNRTLDPELVDVTTFGRKSTAGEN